MNRFPASVTALIRSLVPLIVLALVSPVAGALAAPPVFDATHLHAPHALDSTWLVHAGDDPGYANPNFDDSQWTRFDPTTSLAGLYGKQEPAVVWYRIHIKVDPEETGLGLSENNIAHAFEIYANGQRVMANGQVAPFRSYTFAARLRAKIPDQFTSSGMLVLAMRVHFTPEEWRDGQDPGFYATNLELGQFDTLYREDWLAAVSENMGTWLDDLLVLGLGIVALVLFSAQRSRKEYLWIVAVCALELCNAPLPLISPFINLPIHWEFLNDLLRVFPPYLWGSLYFSFIGQRVGWGWRMVFICTGITNALASMQGVFFSVSVPYQFVISLPTIALLAVIIPIMLAIHWRRGNREAGILLIPVVLFSLDVYIRVGASILFGFEAWRQTAIRIMLFVSQIPIGPFRFSFTAFTDILTVLSLGIIILLRSSRLSRRQALLEAELQAAQQVQQVLVPEQTSNVPGFAVDSIYLPAQQVGGDFFQVLPIADGGLLVIVGDVAGKGLPAAMLVSALVGAIRATAEYTTDPAELLTNLNDRLVGRAGGGFSTALAARIDAGGKVVLANAGHLPPYVDGREIEVPGALPLGIAAGAVYEKVELKLAPGSRITFYSDGVIEATNPSGELLGFERAREFSSKPAVDIAEAARAFGQQDDITVLAIERLAAAMGVA